MQCSASNALIFSVTYLFFVTSRAHSHTHTIIVTSTVGTIISIVHVCNQRVCVDE